MDLDIEILRRAAQIFRNDPILLGRWTEFYDFLYLKDRSKKLTLLNGLAFRTISNYDLFLEILETWKSEKGSMANYILLVEILQLNDFNDVAEQLIDEICEHQPDIYRSVKTDTGKRMLLLSDVPYPQTGLQCTGEMTLIPKEKTTLARLKPGTIRDYDQFLETWKSEKGSESNYEELVKILQQNEFKDQADVLGEELRKRKPDIYQSVISDTELLLVSDYSDYSCSQIYQTIHEVEGKPLMPRKQAEQAFSGPLKTSEFVYEELVKILQKKNFNYVAEMLIDELCKRNPDIYQNLVTDTELLLVYDDSDECYPCSKSKEETIGREPTFITLSAKDNEESHTGRFPNGFINGMRRCLQWLWGDNSWVYPNQPFIATTEKDQTHNRRDSVSRTAIPCKLKQICGNQTLISLLKIGVEVLIGVVIFTLMVLGVYYVFIKSHAPPANLTQPLEVDEEADRLLQLKELDPLSYKDLQNIRTSSRTICKHEEVVLNSMDYIVRKFNCSKVDFEAGPPYSNTWLYQLTSEIYVAGVFVIDHFRGRSGTSCRINFTPEVKIEVDFVSPSVPGINCTIVFIGTEFNVPNCRHCGMPL